MPVLDSLKISMAKAATDLKAALSGEGKPISYYDEGFTARSLTEEIASRDRRATKVLAAENVARKTVGASQ